MMHRTLWIINLYLITKILALSAIYTVLTQSEQILLDVELVNQQEASANTDDLLQSHQNYHANEALKDTRCE